MEILKTPTFGAATHRQVATYTDTPDLANNRIVRA
ncbi:hypothetical protein FHS63_002682 [Azospirillum doebereinerae]